jgi:hypothetical protein
VTADHLGGVLGPELFVAGVDPFRAERQVEVGAGNQSADLQAGPDHLIGGAGVGRGLQDDEHAGLQVAGHGVDGALDGAQVGPAVVRQRGGHADDGDAGLGDL